MPAPLRKLFKFPRNLFHKARIRQPTAASASNEGASFLAESAPTSARNNSTRNVLKFALRTLSSISSSIPLGSVLGAVVEPLLAIVDLIEQTSENTQGLAEMAARIELLTPIVTAMMGNTRERKVVEGFQRELQSITEDLQAARLQGRLNQFFNSADHSSSLEKHNATLAQLIADSTLVTVNEVLQYIHELEFSISAGRLYQGAAPLGVHLRLRGLSVRDFCRQYHVSDTIRDCLEDYGFETVAAVLDASDLILKEDGLKPGQLLELRRAQRSGESGESVCRTGRSSTSSLFPACSQFIFDQPDAQLRFTH